MKNKEDPIGKADNQGLNTLTKISVNCWRISRSLSPSSEPCPPLSHCPLQGAPRTQTGSTLLEPACPWPGMQDFVTFLFPPWRKIKIKHWSISLYSWPKRTELSWITLSQNSRMVWGLKGPQGASTSIWLIFKNYFSTPYLILLPSKWSQHAKFY